MNLDLVLAGWTLIRPVRTPDFVGRAVPDHLTTMSQCIQDDLPRPEWADWSVDRFLLDRAGREAAPDASLVAVAMTTDEAARFVMQLGHTDNPSLSLLRHQQPVDGEPLGFEVVGAEYDLILHSWHCHSYADQAVADLGITLTEQGLLANASDAQAVRDWMLELPSDQAPAPVPWTFIALIPT